MQMDQKTALELVKPHLTNNRYVHTIGVLKTAENLAEKYHADLEKAQIAAIFHDYAKYRATDEMADIILNQGWDEKFIHFNKELLHAPAGSYLVKQEIGIKDEEILSAIFWHTTGNTDMTTLEKIIFLADYIEPNRKFPGVEEVRTEADKSLDTAILMALRNTIMFLLSKGEPIHPKTLAAYNQLSVNFKKKCLKG